MDLFLYSTLESVTYHAYWSHQVYNLGIGTKPMLSKKLTVKNYSDVIWKVVNDKKMLKA